MRDTLWTETVSGLLDRVNAFRQTADSAERYGFRARTVTERRRTGEFFTHQRLDRPDSRRYADREGSAGSPFPANCTGKEVLWAVDILGGGYSG